MGNSHTRHHVPELTPKSSSKKKNNFTDMLDGGFLSPTQLYSSTPVEIDKKVVAKLILENRLAPFYEGEEEDTKKTIVVNSLSSSKHCQKTYSKFVFPMSSCMHQEKEPSRNNLTMDVIYCVECPICFLFYPPATNFTRCCSKPICTECFVHLSSSTSQNNVCCPYCCKEDFAVVYSYPFSQSGITYCHDDTKKSLSLVRGKPVLSNRIKPLKKTPIVNRQEHNPLEGNGFYYAHHILANDMGMTDPQLLEATLNRFVEMEEVMLREAIRLSMQQDLVANDDPSSHIGMDTTSMETFE